VAGETPTAAAPLKFERASPEDQRTPQQQPALLPQDTSTSPAHASPPKTVSTKPAVIKALPTVRDHTTDQLTAEGDEYVPREHDPDGERKVGPSGHPQEGREFKMRTFYVPNRGEKLFMLATECARVLGYRDSYLLFNKNRSLYKIIATQAEKDELIHQEILPYSYRSRQIAIVTAKSMFRQFGARVIADGRRVRDDYWEGKAKKQGFTEEDMAGDKRPGATKARDAAALEAANHDQSGLAHPPILYSDDPAELTGPPQQTTVNPVPMIQMGGRDYGNIPRQRQDISGTPYQDRTQASPALDIDHQAKSASEVNKTFAQQRGFRAQSYKDTWNKEIDTQVSSPQQKVEQSPTVSQSPHNPSAMMSTNRQPTLNQGQIMSPQRYPHQPSHSASQGQSPSRQAMPPAMRPDYQHQHRSSVYNPNQHAPQTSPYGATYPPSSHLWGQPPAHLQPQPQQSPVTPHHPNLSHYSPSPHQQSAPQMHHPSQSPHQQHPQPPPLHHSQSSGSMHGNMTYQSMASMPGGGPAAAYGGMGQRGMYSQSHSGSPTPAQQQYMATTASGQGTMQGWAPPQSPQQGHHGAAGWGGYPSSTGY